MWGVLNYDSFMGMRMAKAGAVGGLLLAAIFGFPQASRANVQSFDGLCVGKINYASPDFYYVDTVSGDTAVAQMEDEPECIYIWLRFDRPRGIYYKKPASNLKVVLGNDTLVDTPVDILKEETSVQIFLDEKVPGTVYMCPWHEGQTTKEAESCPMIVNPFKFTKDLKKYDGQRMKIYFDGQLMRDYTMYMSSNPIMEGLQENSKEYSPYFEEYAKTHPTEKQTANAEMAVATPSPKDPAVKRQNISWIYLASRAGMLLGVIGAGAFTITKMKAFTAKKVAEMSFHQQSNTAEPAMPETGPSQNPLSNIELK